MDCANLLNGIVICKSFLKSTLEKVRMKVRTKRKKPYIDITEDAKKDAISLMEAAPV